MTDGRWQKIAIQTAPYLEPCQPEAMSAWSHVSLEPCQPRAMSAADAENY